MADAPHLWRKLPFILLLASLLVFGCFPRLLTDKIQPSVTRRSSLRSTLTTARRGPEHRRLVRTAVPLASDRLMQSHWDRLEATAAD